MGTYSLKRRPPAVRVSKDLIGSLATYLVEQATRLAGRPIEEISKAMSVEIEDSFGVEKFSSVQQLKTGRLPDSTKRVTIGVYLHRDPELWFSVDLGKDRLDSRIALSFTGENARDSVMAVYSGVIRLLVEARTWAIFFHPHFAVDVLMPTFIIAPLLTMVIPFLAPKAWIAWAWGICALIIYTYAFGWWLKPLTSFDTKRQLTLDAVWRWVSLGLLTFAVFGTLLPLIRSRIVMP